MKNLILVLLALAIGCKQKPSSHNEKYAVPTYKKNAQDPSRHELFQKYIKENNTEQFDRLAGDLELALEFDELLSYSLQMANKNNTPVAYHYIYFVLSHPADGTSFNDLDSRTRNFALFNLIKSYELGYDRAKIDIDEIFGEHKRHEKSEYYLLQYSK